MKKHFLFSVALLAAFSTFAQTKKIAHRSHSGADNTLILTTGDNFGLPASARKDTTVTVKKTTTKIKATKHKAARKTKKQPAVQK